MAGSSCNIETLLIGNSKPAYIVARVPFGIGAKKDRGRGFLVLAAPEMEREPKNKKWGGGGEGSVSLPFFPTPSPLFYSRHFSHGL